MKKKIIISIIALSLVGVSFIAGRQTAPTPTAEEMTVNQQIEFMSTITDWNTDGNELAVTTSDGYEYYAQKSEDIYGGLQNE